MEQGNIAPTEQIVSLPTAIVGTLFPFGGKEDEQDYRYKTKMCRNGVTCFYSGIALTLTRIRAPLPRVLRCYLSPLCSFSFVLKNDRNSCRWKLSISKIETYFVRRSNHFFLQKMISRYKYYRYYSKMDSELTKEDYNIFSTEYCKPLLLVICMLSPLNS